MKMKSSYVAEGEHSFNVIIELPEGSEYINNLLCVAQINKELNGAEMYANMLCDNISLIEKVMKGPTLYTKQVDKVPIDYLTKKYSKVHEYLAQDDK